MNELTPTINSILTMCLTKDTMSSDSESAENINIERTCGDTYDVEYIEKNID